MIKLKGAHFLTAFLMGTLFPVFLGAAELPTYQKYQGPIKPGIVITSKNYQQYLPELQKLLNPGMYNMVVQGLERGLLTLPIEKTVEYPQPKAHEYYTQKYAGTSKIGPKGELVGWKAGMPFPYPKNAREVGWNADRKYQAGDQLSTKNGKWLLFDRGGKLERSLTWDYWEMKYTGRCLLSPIHEVPGNNGIIQKKFSFRILDPFDIRGFSMIRIRYEDIKKPDDVYSYIPAIRRVRRLTGSDTADPMLGTDIIYDDFNLFYQKITPEVTFEVVEKDMLVTSHWLPDQEGGKRFAPLKGNCFQVSWQIRPVWVLTMYPNDPNYPYSKRVIVVEKQRRIPNGYAVDTYDQSGRLYRGQWFINRIEDDLVLIGQEGKVNKAIGAPPYYEGSTAGVRYDDFLSGHSTVLQNDFIASDPFIEPKTFSFELVLKGIK